MIRSKIFCGLVGVALGWTATGHAAQVPRPYEQGKETVQEVESNPKDPPPVPYVERRRIGLLKKGLSACPPVDGWQGDSLLDLALGGYGRESKKKTDHDLRQLGLDRLCVYTAIDPSKPFQRPQGLIKEVKDRMAIAPLAPGGADCPPQGALGKGFWPTLEDHFLRQIGQVKLAPSGNPGVRLVFIDTQPTGEGLPVQPGRSCHGYTMAHLAYQLVCGGGEPCAIEFATRGALCHKDYEPNMAVPLPGSGCKEGGDLGTVMDLALAILDEVIQWEHSDPHKKLILNLSIGWDGEQDAGQLSELDTWKVSKLDPSTLAVYKVLRYAARRGVLVIAAAGNRRGGRPNTRGPVLPAAWELRRPPCPLFAFGRKPVYAVGGVDWQGLPLPNSRRGGRPRRVAYADHAITRIAEPAAQISGESTSMYTGTSVSAAVASSIAATLWYLRPDLGPAGVMRLMNGSADRLDSRADFYAWKPLARPPRMQRVSLCRSILSECWPDGSRCPALESVDCRLWKHPPATLRARSLPSAPISSTPTASVPDCDPGPRLFMITGAVSTFANLCPMEVFPDLQTPGWTGPQPGDNPCPTCTLVPEPPENASLSSTSTESQSYALLAEIDPQWQEDATKAGAQIVGAVLAIDCYTSGGLSRQVNFDLTAYFPQPGIVAKLVLGPIDGRSSIAGCTASVDFKIASAGEPNRSVQSPVYVDP